MSDEEFDFQKYHYDVICKNCRGHFYRTKENFTLDRPTNPLMIELKKTYDSYQWQELPPDETVHFEALECPECGAPFVLETGRPILDLDSADRILKPDTREFLENLTIFEVFGRYGLGHPAKGETKAAIIDYVIANNLKACGGLNG